MGMPLFEWHAPELLALDRLLGLGQARNRVGWRVGKRTLVLPAQFKPYSAARGHESGALRATMDLNSVNTAC
jgi:hypothetical protein